MLEMMISRSEKGVELNKSIDIKTSNSNVWHLVKQQSNNPNIITIRNKINFHKQPDTCTSCISTNISYDKHVYIDQDYDTLQYNKGPYLPKNEGSIY